MEGKSVLPTEITYMDTEEEYKYMVSKIHIFKVHIFKIYIYCILRSLRYIYSNPLRFPISSLGLPNFSFSGKLRGSVG
jgi:hypothetical protein